MWRLTFMVLLALLALTACGAARVVEEPYLAVMEQAPTLYEGHVRQLVQVQTPSGEPAADCRLSWSWRTASQHGELGPLTPTEGSGRDAVWRIEAEVGAIDVVAVASHVTCGVRSRDVGERWGGTPAGEARYCGLCVGDRSPTTPSPGRERERPGVELLARAGVAIEARDARVVDRCTERTLLELSDIPGAFARGGTDRESELQLLLAADEGQEVCARAVPGAVQIELGPSATSEVAARLANVAEVSAVLSLPPMPG